jgi:hypothetical protein
MGPFLDPALQSQVKKPRRRRIGNVFVKIHLEGLVVKQFQKRAYELHVCPAVGGSFLGTTQMI